MYFVYILLSKKDDRTYTGYSNDVRRRLFEHNSGRVTATKNRIPFEIFLVEEFETEQEAKKRELWWKSSSGRNRLKELFNAENLKP